MANEVIKRAEQILNGMKCRSAWNRGVKVYALELLEALGEAIEGGWFDPDDLASPRMVQSGLLNGADSWHEFSWGGCSLIYDTDIAARLCTKSELERTKGGIREPNKREAWLDVQTRALFQASRKVNEAIFEALKGV